MYALLLITWLVAAKIDCSFYFTLIAAHGPVLLLHTYCVM